MERHSCLLWWDVSLYDDTLSIHDDTLLSYDDTLSIHDDTLSLYDDTLSEHTLYDEKMHESIIDRGILWNGKLI